MSENIAALKAKVQADTEQHLLDEAALQHLAGIGTVFLTGEVEHALRTRFGAIRIDDLKFSELDVRVWVHDRSAPVRFSFAVDAHRFEGCILEGGSLCVSDSCESPASHVASTAAPQTITNAAQMLDILDLATAEPDETVV